MIRIEIETDNDAFQGDQHEIGRILHILADRAYSEILEECPIMDINGNKVGKVEIS